MLTHDPLDPSVNAATGRAASNLIGAPGAAAADLLLQAFGWAGAAAALGLLAWGLILMVRGARGRPAMLGWLRFMAGLAGVTGFALAAAALPMPVSWPFAAGLGGLLGDHALAGLAGLIALSGIPGASLAAAGLGLALAVAGLFFCFGLTMRDIGAASDRAVLAWATVRVWGDQLIGAAPRPWRRDRDTAERPQPDGRAETAPGFLQPGRAAPTGLRAKPKAEPEAETGAAVKIAPRKRAKASDREVREAQGALAFAETSGFDLPRLDLLSPSKVRQDVADPAALAQNAELLATVLADFSVKGEITAVRPGPVVTLYELEPAPGVKTSRVINVADDIARSMAAQACRIAVVPGATPSVSSCPTSAARPCSCAPCWRRRALKTPRPSCRWRWAKPLAGSPIRLIWRACRTC